MRDPSSSLRRRLGSVLLLGMSGVGAELALTEHYEGWRQYAPLVVLGAGILAVAWDLVASSVASARFVRGTMALLVITAVLGLYYHYESNEEFQRELEPSLSGVALVWATMRATSPPSLAPGMLAVLGAIGWIATQARDSHPPTTR